MFSSISSFTSAAPTSCSMETIATELKHHLDRKTTFLLVVIHSTKEKKNRAFLFQNFLSSLSSKMECVYGFIHLVLEVVMDIFHWNNKGLAILSLIRWPNLCYSSESWSSGIVFPWDQLHGDKLTLLGVDMCQLRQPHCGQWTAHWLPHTRGLAITTEWAQFQPSLSLTKNRQ